MGWGKNSSFLASAPGLAAFSGMRCWTPMSPCLTLTNLTIGSNFCQVRVGNEVSAADGGGIQSEIWDQKYKLCLGSKTAGRAGRNDGH